MTKYGFYAIGAGLSLPFVKMLDSHFGVLQENVTSGDIFKSMRRHDYSINIYMIMDIENKMNSQTWMFDIIAVIFII